LFSQEKLMKVYQNGNVVYSELASAIDSIRFDNVVADADGVVINGIRWATRNVDAPGTFAATPESPGMFYQWNRPTAWTSTGSVSGWDSSESSGTTWEKANDPSPAGWRIPTLAELETLLDTDKVSNERTTLNGVNGRRFTDKATGNSIFLPAAGCRRSYDGTLYTAGTDGGYWSSTQYDGSSAYGLFFDSAYAPTLSASRSMGLYVRCVSDRFD
jgi:uncharacterized protein (TIGR02145 family)